MVLHNLIPPGANPESKYVFAQKRLIMTMIAADNVLSYAKFQQVSYFGLEFRLGQCGFALR